MSTNHPDAELICRLEMSLLQPAIRQSPAELGLVLADDFLEFGSSGKIYRKQDLLTVLAKETWQPSTITDFEVRGLTPDVVLATYRVQQMGPSATVASLRSSLWQRRAGRWQLVFHQGTPLPG